MTDAPRTVRPGLLWPHVLERLRTHAAMTALMPSPLPGPHAITMRREAAFRGAEGEPWARVILVPIVLATASVVGAGHQDVAGDIQEVPFLVRVDVNDPGGDAFYAQDTIEAVHDAAHAALVGWAPTVDGVRVAFPIWRNTLPPGQPLELDEQEQGVVFGSAEYRAGLVRAPYIS